MALFDNEKVELCQVVLQEYRIQNTYYLISGFEGWNVPKY